MWHARASLGTVAREDRGAQAVEFALILPVLLIIVMGIINFGYAFSQKLALNQAVREGARKAVVSKTAVQADVVTFVRDSTGGLIDDTSLVIVTTKIQSGGPAPAFGAFTDSADDPGDTGDGNTPTCRNYTDAQGMGGQLKVIATYQSTWLVPTPFWDIAAPNFTTEAVFRCEVI